MAEFKRELGRGRMCRHPIKTSKQTWAIKYAEEECDGHFLSFVVCFLSTLALEKIMPSSCCVVFFVVYFFFHGRHMSISTAFFVSPCLILFCIICSICKWQNK